MNYSGEMVGLIIAISSVILILTFIVFAFSDLIISEERLESEEQKELSGEITSEQKMNDLWYRFYN